MKRILILLVLSLALPIAARAATVTSGSLTITEQGRPGYLQCYTFDWTSDASGNVTASITEVQGTIERVVFNPDGTSNFPTCVTGATSLAITNAGAAKGGVLRVYIRR